MINPQNKVFTSIEINATPMEVWDVLTDWKALKEWSSSFIGVSKDKIEKGDLFISYFEGPILGKIIEFEHVCTDFEVGEKFGWSGRIIKNLNDHHVYSMVESDNNTTIFTQEDGLHGKHSDFMNFLVNHKMLDMYKKFNSELKNRVEFLYPRI